MDTQYFGERLRPSESVERTDQDASSPVDNPDLYADQAPVDAALVPETPMVETAAVLDPMYTIPVEAMPVVETVAAVAPMVETPAQEIPIVETVAVVSPMDETKPYKATMGETVSHEAPTDTNTESLSALLSREESEHFRTRWNEIQGKFVDEPRSAVQQADGLVSEVIEQITQMFAKEHGSLESQWNQGNDVSTEELRKALKRYRSFFNRLVV